MSIAMSMITSSVRTLLGLRSHRTVSIEPQKGCVTKSADGPSLSIDRLYLRNESAALRQLRERSKRSGLKTVHIPEIIKYTDSSITSITTRYWKGTKLNAVNAEQQKKALSQLIPFLSSLKKVDKELSLPLGTRSPAQLLLSSVTLLMRALFKAPEHARMSSSVFFSFFMNYAPVLFASPILTIAHRDLDADNILLNERGELLLTDWENAVQTDPLYDLAQLPRLYGHILGYDWCAEFCQSNLTSTQEVSRWHALLMYGCLQSIALDHKNSHMLAETLSSARVFLPAPKTVYELVSGFCFWALGLLFAAAPWLWRKPNGPVVLCYHSVGTDQWRYSTPPQELREHIAFLQSEFLLGSLTEVVRGKKTAAITFDDGYANLVTHALPVLLEAKTTACVFALGDVKQANRQELDNALPLLTNPQLLALKKNGWEIGHHTHTHPALAQCNLATLKAEITDSKKALEKQLRQKISYFAYPKGVYSRLITAEVAKAGFTHAFTVDNKTMQSSNPHTLHRIALERNTSVMKLRAILSPPGLLLTQFFWIALQYKDSLISRSVVHEK